MLIMHIFFRHHMKIVVAMVTEIVKLLHENKEPKITQ